MLTHAYWTYQNHLQSTLSRHEFIQITKQSKNTVALKLNNIFALCDYYYYYYHHHDTCFKFIKKPLLMLLQKQPIWHFLNHILFTFSVLTERSTLTINNENQFWSSLIECWLFFFKQEVKGFGKIYPLSHFSKKKSRINFWK